MRYSNAMKRIAKDIATVKAQFYDKKAIRVHLSKIKELLQSIPAFPQGT